MASRFTKGLKGLGKDTEGSAPKPDAPKPLKKNASVQSDVSSARYEAPSRVGKKPVTGFFDPAVRQQLAILAAEEQRSQNDLIAEALNMLFQQYGKSPIAKG